LWRNIIGDEVGRTLFHRRSESVKRRRLPKALFVVPSILAYTAMSYYVFRGEV
jgi:hypothetical protein